MKRILLFLFLCLTIFKIQAQTPIVLTFNSNDPTNWADGIAQDGEGGSTNIPGLSLQIFNISNVSGAKLNFPMEWKNAAELSGDDGFTGLTTYNGNPGIDWFGTAIKSADGAEFKINRFSCYDWGWWSGELIQVKGYRDNVEVAASNFVGNVNGNRVVVDLSSNNNFNNVDEVRILITVNDVAPAINDISITPHVYASSVSSTKSNGSYKAGEIIPVNVLFSEPVNVTGNPQLKLETGTTDRIINYASGTGTSTLTFNYTVVNGDNSSKLSYFDSQALTLNGGQIKAVSNGFNAALTLPVPGESGSLNANKDIIIDGIVPTLTSVNSSTANGTYKEGDVIAINLNFSEAITVTGTPQLTMNSGATINYSSGSGTSTLSFNYTVQAGDSSADLDYISTAALSLNGGTLSDEVGNNAVLTLPVPGAANSLGANKNIVIDTTSPVVSSVSSSLANGTYKINSSIPVSVNFSEVVIVTGTPTLSLNSGGTASYVSGSGTTTLVFNYTVALNQSIADLDQASTTALALGTGTIKDAVGNNATLTLAAPGAAGSLGTNKNIVINTTTPTLVSLNRIGVATISGSSTQFLMTFSENVTGVDATDFNITSTGITGPSVTSVSGSNDIWTVTVNTGIGSGTLRLDLKSSGTGILNSIGNEIQGGYTSGQTYTIDKAIPALTTVAIASNNANTARAKVGDVVTLSFTASEAIGTPVVSILGNTVTVTNATANDWTATYITQTADANGIIPFNIAFADVAGNVGTAVTATTNAGSVTYDKTLPTLTTVAIVSNNASNQTAKTGNIISLTFTASEAVAVPVVTIAGNPVVPTSAGGTSFLASYTLAGAETEGTVTFNIAFADLTGNTGTGVTATTNSSSVTYDKTTPTLSIVTIASNNQTVSNAKAGDVITLNFRALEIIATPTVTIGGTTVTPTNSGGNNWVATQIVSGLTPEGVLAFNIAFSDLTGNAGTPVTASTNSSSVTVDRTVPAVPTGLAATAGNTQNAITWNASPAPDLDKYILYAGTTINPTTAIQTIPAGTLAYTHTGLTNGIGYFYSISAVDLTGNEGAKLGNIVSVPKGVQTITFNPLAASVYGASSVTLTASSSSALAVTYTSSNTAVATVSGGTVTILAAGTTTITASQAGDAAFLAATPVTQDLVVNKKDIAVTAVAKTKIYGTTDPVFNYTFSPALIGTDTFTGVLDRILGDNVGVYGINQGTVALNANYTITFTSADLEVTAKPVTITAAAKTKTYGVADPAFTYTVAPVLIGTDTFTGSLTRTTGENIGSYAINQGTLTAGSNYLITYVPANLNIGTKSITVTATAASKTYGAADPALTYTFSSALIGTDSFSGSLGRAAGENVGTYAINKNTLALNSNYVLNYTTANLTIGKAALSIIAEDKEKFTGTANPTFTVKYTGLINGETGAVLTTPATLSTTATINSPIGTYTIVPSGAVSTNYQISYVNGILTIKPGAPTNVLFARTTLYENRASGTAAGTLSSTSDDPLATFAYSLVSGTGDTDNALFSVNGNQLLTAAGLDYENKATYSVRVRSTTQHGFSLDKTFTIALSDVNELPTLAAIANQTICYTPTAQNINLTGISAGPETAQNTSISVAGNNSALLQSLTVSGSGATAIINYSIKNGASGTATVTVTVKDNGGIDNGGVDTFSRTFVITVNALPVVAINSDKGTQISKGEIVMLSATGGASYAWAANGSIQSGLNLASIKARPLVTTTYTVTATNASGCAETQIFTITVLDDMAKVKAHNIMSPNGDGINDNWVIENIDVYPNNEVKIFDRSGRLMYSKKGYDNSWDARLNGAPLAEGTYYYLIDFGPGKSKIKGFITIPKSN